MKIAQFFALLLISFSLAACDSTSSSAKKADAKPAAKTTAKPPVSTPNLGTAGNPIRPSRNGEYNGVDPMSSGTDGRMYNKNY